jgi:putative transcriptional regulator
MTWTSFHRRGDVLRGVIAAADQRRDGALPTDIEGVTATFADDLDLLAALQLKWHTRLAGRIEREQMSQPMNLRAAVVRAWHQTADELPGIRAILDEARLRPADEATAEIMRKSAAKEHVLLAVMAGEASAQPHRGGGEGHLAVVRRARGGGRGHRAADLPGPAEGGPGRLTRIVALAVRCEPASLERTPPRRTSLPPRAGPGSSASGVPCLRHDGVMVDRSSELRAGMLLVATPQLLDPNFADTVVLILDVDDGGALGVVLNRPSGVPVAEVLETWGEIASEPEVLFRGGPVSTEGALGVALLRDGDDVPIGFREVDGLLGLVDLDTPVELVTGSLAGMRIFAGYAGWGADQLAAEIDEGSWYVVPGEPVDVFRLDPDELWRDVLRRQPGELAWHSTRPVDPELN